MPLRPAPAEDWSALLGRSQTGDRHAFEALVRSVRPYLRNLVRRGLRDPADIEDVVQDVLLTLHQISHTYLPGRPVAPWLTAIARRRIIDRIRQNRRHAQRQQALADVLLTRSNFDPHGIEFDEYGRLYAAIDQLPERQREAILLLKLWQISLKEAATVTGQSVGALKVAVHRGAKRLRGSLCPLTQAQQKR